MADKSTLSSVLVSRYEELFETICDKNIAKQELGFEVDYCSSIINFMLIHCFENIDIFSDSQIDNLIFIGNKLKNG